MFGLILVAALSQSEISITRVPADANFFLPKKSKELTRFMMDETYGTCRPLSAAWAQRGVLDATADSDFFSRLEYYGNARAAGASRGAIFIAERDDGAICGFADVGASLWLPGDQCFRLPQTAELQRIAATGIGANGQRTPGVELRPYLSNLVVDTSLRRCGVGRRLMEACEEEATSWMDTCCISGAKACQDIWLEVTTTNTAALKFYGALGYQTDGRTAGNEVIRDVNGGGFRMADVQRFMMKKPLKES